ncbi:hypothetical protein SPSIL_008650 [Sporomusa silvacetica DSM 10669]|uniref:Uncharacterized protein n=1 Tax=Sporomusa silvacetica DSM 10669 TaxID=1123289 RepID=A0ABZ3IGG2_9FIRM|nr:hypothetical protein [Sporomusa silvacetica]OZC13175.1 hypothetical protein SPSIL_56310 [Sporomusa silvacetica DSM 10669]
MSISRTVQALQRESRIAVHWAQLAKETTRNRERKDYKKRSGRHKKQAEGFQAILTALLRKEGVW